MKKKILNLRLNLFEGEGAAGGEGEGQAAAGQERAIVYGKQDQAAAGQETETKVTSNTLEDKNAKFDELVKGEYKEQFQKRMSGAINKRFAQMKSLQEQNESMQYVMEKLMGRYGVSDIAKLNEAIDADDGYFEKEAMERGMSVEALKELKRLQAENEQYHRQQAQAMEIQEQERINQMWSEQEVEMKQWMPGFDFHTEMENEAFRSMVLKGVDLKAAYQAAHFDELIGGGMQYAAQQTRKDTVDSIKARNMRPVENGVTGQPGVTYKTDVSKLTKKDRAEIARRVARGENISF